MTWLRYLDPSVTEAKWDSMPPWFNLGEQEAGTTVPFEWRIKNPTAYDLNLEWVVESDAGDDIFQIEAPKHLAAGEGGSLKLIWRVGYEPVRVKPRIGIKETLHVPVG
jgi:hypothetical protein